MTMQTDWPVWRELFFTRADDPARGFLTPLLEEENEYNRLQDVWRWASDCVVDSEFVRVCSYRMGGNGMSAPYYAYAFGMPERVHVTAVTGVERGRVVSWTGTHLNRTVEVLTVK